MNSFTIEGFKVRRGETLELLGSISDVAAELQVESEKELMDKTIQELEKESFHIVVVGEFSRGKSTFINAMLGYPLLPSSKLPTTTILNKIHYHEKPQYAIHYRKTGDVEHISEEAFRTLVAPPDPIPGDKQSEQEYQENLDQFTKISHAEIGFPTDFCKDGVELIDTPGTNDLDTAREEITYKFIPESDAAIFILSARRPLADSEMRFLKDRIIANDIQKVFFIVNFKDRLRTERDQKKVVDYIYEHLQGVVDEPRIFLLSAKGALNARRQERGEKVKGKVPTFEESGFAPFEKELGDFLSNNRGKTKLRKPIERGIRVANGLIHNSIAVSRGGLHLSLHELEEKLAELQIELNKARDSSSQALQRLSTHLVQGGQQIRDEVELELKQIANRAVQTVDYYTGPLTKEDIAQEIEHQVAPMQTALQAKIKAKQQQLVEECVETMNRRLAKDWRLLDEKVTNALVIKRTDGNNNELAINVDQDDSVLVKTGLGSLGIFAVASSLGLGIFALPVVLFGGGALFSHFEEKARERALGKIRGQIDRRYRDIIPGTINKMEQQWNEVMNETVNYAKQEINSKLQTIENQFRQVIHERKQEQFEVERKRQFLDEQENQLEKVIQRLTALMTEMAQ